jgi:hypothetical protein
MKRSRTIRITLATVLCTAAAAQSALAGGEPKSTVPFTHHVTTGRSEANVSLTARSFDRGSTAHSGEAKNQPPFTNPTNIGGAVPVSLLSSRSEMIVLSPEPKNQPPFMRRARQ